MRQIHPSTVGPSQPADYWDRLAATFDDEPDHGLRDPAIRDAWRDMLAEWLPAGRVVALDIGCGTGSLSSLLAALGHRVVGTDWSPEMIARARAKVAAAGLTARFFIMDAAAPALAPGRFDVVLCRHLLWALPDPARALRRWAGLLAPGGQLVLIEGYWHTGGGLHAGEIVHALPPSLTNARVHDLTGRPNLWGGDVGDERYAIVALSEA